MHKTKYCNCTCLGHFFRLLALFTHHSLCEEIATQLSLHLFTISMTLMMCSSVGQPSVSHAPVQKKYHYIAFCYNSNWSPGIILVGFFSAPFLAQWHPSYSRMSRTAHSTPNAIWPTSYTAVAWHPKYCTQYPFWWASKPNAFKSIPSTWSLVSRDVSALQHPPGPYHLLWKSCPGLT